MKSENPSKHKLATWAAGVLGMWAGFASVGALLAALLSPHWALVREPIVLEETSHGDNFAPKVGVPSDYYFEDHFDNSLNLKPVVTTVTFRLGLWNVCPYINTTGLHMMVVRPPCTRVPYIQSLISHRELHLPAPAPLVQSVIARMRISTPFLAGACILLTIGSLLALISRCCYSHAAIFAALLFTLGGLSVGVGVVWFISVVSEEFGTSFGRKTSWVGMYAYWYGWSLGAAGGAGIGALLAALLTAHAHVSRHTPHFSHVCEDALQRPLLRCRSEGCLGGRSCTSDTLRTYLTSDSRRVCGGRTCTHGQIVDRSPSLVDLTRSSIESSRQDHLQDTSVSNATSDDDILNIVQQHQPLQHYQGSQCSHSQAQSEQQTVQKPQGDQSKVQYHYQHQNTHHKQAKKVVSEKSQSNTTSDESKLMSQAIVETPKTITSSSIVSTAPTHTSSSPSSGSSSTTGNQSLSQQLQHNQHYQTLQPHHHQHSQHAHHHTPQHPHHSEQNTQNDQPQKHSQRSHLARQSSVPPRASLIPATCPPPPTLPTNASTSSQGSSVRQSSSCSSSEPSRLPQLNTFTSDYSKTLPLKEVRRMAVFNRGNTNRSTTLSRPSAKLSSEV